MNPEGNEVRLTVEAVKVVVSTTFDVHAAGGETKSETEAKG